MFLQTGEDSPFHYSALSSALLTIYVLAQGIVFLVKKKRVIKPDPVHALQIDLEKLELNVIELDGTLDKQNIQINNKLDMLLSQFDEHRGEFKDMRRQHQDFNDRMIRLEEAIKRRPVR